MIFLLPAAGPLPKLPALSTYILSMSIPCFRNVSRNNFLLSKFGLAVTIITFEPFRVHFSK